MQKIKNIEVIRYKNGKNEKTIDSIVSDETTHIIINNTFTYNFSTLPDSLIDFATGYLIGEGKLNSIDEIKEINVDKKTINVKIDNYNEEKKDLVLCSNSSGGWRSKIKNINEIIGKI